MYDYDIAIIGSGIAGSMLGAILAKNGLNVVLLDAGTHPRFAVGESMIPESGVLLRLLAERYDIPELRYPGEIDLLMRNVGTSSAGIKLSFSFAWSGKHREHDPLDVVSTPVLSPEAHLFRQDVDAYYVALAAHLGATIRQQIRISAVVPDSDGVTIEFTGKDPIRVRYVVDAAGFRSPVADAMKLRDGAPEMQSRTRSIFTHMVDVTLYDDAIAATDRTGSPTALSQSTLHHLFDCGWLWIIPFNNQPFSTNPICSVGLQLHIDTHGPAGDPESEFREFLAEYPSAARHFENAKRVREWTVAPRLNYNSRQTVGDRYCLLGHAAGFVDPLFSRGLANTFESINRIAPKLIRAAREDRWKKEDFASYERYSLKVVHINDRLVANSYSAFRSFPLWNAWFRIWLSGSYIGVLRWRRILSDFLTHRDETALDRAFEETSYPGHLSLESGRFEAMFDAASEMMEAYEAGERTEHEVIAFLQQLYLDNRLHLPVDFSDFENRFVSRPTDTFAASLLHWANHAPDGLSAKLERPAGGSFDFLDDFRYGDRLEMAMRADKALAAVRGDGRAKPADAEFIPAQ